MRKTFFRCLLCHLYQPYGEDGILGYSGMLAMSARMGLIEYYSKALSETSNLYVKSLNIINNNGLYARAPYISLPTETDYVNSKEYLSGLNPFSKKRSLNFM